VADHIHPALRPHLVSLARDLRAGKYRHVEAEYHATGPALMTFKFVDTGRLPRASNKFFNMNYGHAIGRCGTAFCVYGLLRERGAPDDLMVSAFNHADDSKLHDLFYPQGNVDYDRVTPRHAARAIDQLLAGRRPDYEGMRGLAKAEDA